MRASAWLSLVFVASVVVGSIGPPRPAPVKAAVYVVGFDALPPHVDRWVTGAGATLLRTDATLHVAVVLAPAALEPVLRHLPGATWVEADRPVTLFDVPTDPLWPQQWGPQKIRLPEARDLVTGSPDVVVAVLDTGVDWKHTDLAANIWNENGEHGYNLQQAGNLARCALVVPADGAPACVEFWSEDDRLLTPMDVNGHGTHVAGIIAAVADNGDGIAGLAQVRILPVKVLASGNSMFNTFDHVAAGIVLATQAGAQIISMSLGACGGDIPTELQVALDYAWGHGVVIIAAAGNNGDETPCWPAAYPKVVSVSATDASDTIAAFSSRGDTIDVSAPGVDILSTRSRWIQEFGFSYTGGGDWSLSGTSMAAPHAAGVAALVESANPALTNQQVRDLLESTAVDLGAPGPDPLYGHGRIDARAAVEAALALKAPKL